MSPQSRWLVPFVAAASIALPAAAQEVTLKVHHFWAPTAMPPSMLLGPWCDQDREGFEQPDEMPDLSGDAARRRAAAAHPAGQWTASPTSSGRFPATRRVAFR